MISASTNAAEQVFGADKALDILSLAGWRMLDDHAVCSCRAEGEEYLSFFAARREHADTLGLSFAQAHAPLYTHQYERTLVPSFAPGSPYRLLAEKTRLACRACKLLGAPYLVIHPLRLFRAKTPEERLAYNRMFFSYVLEEADGVRLAAENMMSLGQEGDCHEADFQLALVDSFRGELAACLDTGHYNTTSLLPEDAVRLLGKRIEVLHLNGNDGVHDLHLGLTPDSLHWGAVAAALKDIGYGGVFNCEIKYQASKTGADYLAEEKRILQQVDQFRKTVV